MTHSHQLSKFQHQLSGTGGSGGVTHTGALQWFDVVPIISINIPSHTWIIKNNFTKSGNNLIKNVKKTIHAFASQKLISKECTKTG